MTKKISLNDYILKNKADFMKKRLSLQYRRSASRRLRDKTERIILMKLDLIRYQRSLKEKKLEIINSNHYKLTI